MIRKLYPFPTLSVFLLLMWLLLSGFSAGHLVLGMVLATVLPLGTLPFWPNVPRLRNFHKLVLFVLMVHWDIVVANLSVARRILGSPKKLRPAFVEVPLDIKDDFAITLLTSTVSLTPGTVSADISADASRMLVHALHVEDEAVLVDQIKQRYERRLKEIFEC